LETVFATFRVESMDIRRALYGSSVLLSADCVWMSSVATNTFLLGSVLVPVPQIIPLGLWGEFPVSGGPITLAPTALIDCEWNVRIPAKTAGSWTEDVNTFLDGTVLYCVLEIYDRANAIISRIIQSADTFAHYRPKNASQAPSAGIQFTTLVQTDLVNASISADEVLLHFRATNVSIQDYDWNSHLRFYVHCGSTVSNDEFSQPLVDVDVAGPSLSALVPMSAIDGPPGGLQAQLVYPVALPMTTVNLTMRSHAEFHDSVVSPAMFSPLCSRRTMYASLPYTHCVAQEINASVIQSWLLLEVQPMMLNNWQVDVRAIDNSTATVFQYLANTVSLTSLAFGSCIADVVSCAWEGSVTSQSSLSVYYIPDYSESFTIDWPATISVWNNQNVSSPSNQSSAPLLSVLHGSSTPLVLSVDAYVPLTASSVCHFDVVASQVNPSFTINSAATSTWQFVGVQTAVELSAIVADWTAMYAQGFVTEQITAACTMWNRQITSQPLQVIIVQTAIVATQLPTCPMLPVASSGSHGFELSVHPLEISLSASVPDSFCIDDACSILRSPSLQFIGLNGISCTVAVANDTTYTITPASNTISTTDATSLVLPGYYIAGTLQPATVEILLNCKRLQQDQARSLTVSVPLMTASIVWNVWPGKVTEAFALFPAFSVHVLLDAGIPPSGCQQQLDALEQEARLATLCTASMVFLNDTGSSTSRFAQPVTVVPDGSWMATFGNFSASAPRGEAAFMTVSCSMAGVDIPTVVTSNVLFAGCPAGFTPSGIGWFCEQCPSGSYGEGGIAKCVDCPILGASCENGLLTLLQNYYRPPHDAGLQLSDKSELHPCFNTESCVVNSTARTFGCSTGYTGPLCGVCDRSIDYGLFSDSCMKCWPPWTGYLILSVIAAAILGVVAFIIRKNKRERSESAIGLRILLTYTQTVAALTAFRAGGVCNFVGVLFSVNFIV
jgi:hypothetical protein